MMSADTAQAWAFAEDFLPEDEFALQAREVALHMGAPAPSVSEAALLRFLAVAHGVSSAVEVGTSAGVAALWLFAGMEPDGVITTIDAEAEFQRTAKKVCEQAGIRSARLRAINDRPSDVLPRLADASYDLVFVNDGLHDPVDLLPELMRLLRPHGLLIFSNALASGNVPDPARRDPTTTAMRQLGRMISEREDCVSVLVPAGDGILLTAKK